MPADGGRRGRGRAQGGQFAGRAVAGRLSGGQSVGQHSPTAFLKYLFLWKESKRKRIQHKGPMRPKEFRKISMMHLLQTTDSFIQELLTQVPSGPKSSKKLPINSLDFSSHF